MGGLSWLVRFFCLSLLADSHTLKTNAGTRAEVLNSNSYRALEGVYTGYIGVILGFIGFRD